MKSLLIACASFLAIGLAPPVRAQDAILPPPELVDTALAAHPKVVAGNARIHAAEALARGLAVGPHEFELSGGYNRRDVRREGRYDEFDATLRRGVRLPGKASLDRRAGSLGVQVAELSRDEARHEVALELADHWFDWLAASAEAAVQAETVTGHERELAGVRRRVQLKDASALDADQTTMELERARAQLADDRGRASAAFAKLLALYPAVLAPERAPILPEPALGETEAMRLRDLAIERDHEVAAAAAEAERQTVLADRARKDRVPDPSLGVRVFSERSRDEWGGGLVATIPFGGARRSAAVEQHLAESRAAAAELAALMAASRAAAEASRIATLSAVEAWGASARALDSATSAVRRQRIAHAAGASSLAELLYVERQAGEAARAEALKRAAATKAIVRLQINAHLLWASPDHAPGS
jgi:cobalt-zinc-cadmium efflux system outer membrane protein